MEKIDKSKVREIIVDFAQEIEQRKKPGPKPQKEVIYFRNERKLGFERDVYDVPIDLLRYRKDNGRIRADVISYEKEVGVLDETSKEAQKKICEMLDRNDPEKNDELERSILQEGQREPAIITCDGFLINGNRRKMTIERINDKKPGTIKFMKVVILPGKNDPGGPPSLLEIEEIENRYQHQSEGKAEYTKFNTALSIQRKINMGFSLEAQLVDDPIYAGLNEKEFKKEVKTIREQYLEPLECIDRYLEVLGREGLYNTISARSGDREGRWQAFLDYYNHVYKKISDSKQRMTLGIEESEIGKIEDIAFKIIRKREFPRIGKVHQIMRDLPKWLSNSEAKKDLYRIVYIPNELKDGKKVNVVDKEDDDIDKIWASEHQEIYGFIKSAKNTYEQGKVSETPLDLLEVSLKKLQHENMVIEAINKTDFPRAKKLIKQIRETIKELENEFYDWEKQN